MLLIQSPLIRVHGTLRSRMVDIEKPPEFFPADGQRPFRDGPGPVPGPYVLGPARLAEERVDVDAGPGGFFLGDGDGDHAGGHRFAPMTAHTMTARTT